MQNNNWLSLAEYSSKYKVSVSTLRRRIKSKKAENIYEDGKYYLKNAPLKDHIVNTFGELTPHRSSPKETAVAPPHNYLGLDLEASSLSFEQKVKPQKDNANTVVSPNVEFLLKELKNAYTLILKEKEEQIILLKDEMTDLRMLAKALEGRCEHLEKNLSNKKQPTTNTVEEIHPQPIELEYVPTPNLELASDWLDEDL